MATSTKKAKQALPSNLAFARSIEPTEALMEAVAAGKGFAGIQSIFDDAGAQNFTKRPVQITTTTVRGTIAHYDKVAPVARVDIGSKAINAANIATIERALLPADAAHLLVSFSVRFGGHSLTPTMNNHPEFTGLLKDFLQDYANKGGYEELALRYVLNLANGSWMWRNRFGDEMQVRLQRGSTAVVFEEGDVDMSKGFVLTAITDSAKRAVIAQFVTGVADALAGRTAVYSSETIHCAALVKMGAGAEVYPSQEFSSEGTEEADDAPRGKDKVGKVLSKNRLTDGTQAATIHARKINNAIRTIDTWHDVDGVGPIAVEVFGANTHQSVAYRVNDNDLYSYLKDPVSLRETLKGGVAGMHHYVVACLVRGGVYGFGKAAE
jgi:CRISPR-associated protein Csy3